MGWNKAAILSLVAALVVAPFAPLLARQAATPAPTPKPAAAPAGNITKGKALFDANACSACHTLAAAEASGDIGPSFDNNKNLNHDLILARVKDGQGAMPPFGSQLSDADVEDVAAYLLSAAKK